MSTEESPGTTGGGENGQDEHRDGNGNLNLDDLPWKSTPPYRGFQSFSHCRHPDEVRKENTYANSEEYFKDLKIWLQQAFIWHSVTAAFPYYLMCEQRPENETNNTTGTARDNSAQNYEAGQFSFPNFTPAVGPQEQAVRRRVRRSIPDGIECRIPSFWKRVVAEMLDFFILFFLKLGATYITLDFIEIVDFDKLFMLPKDSSFEYKTILKMTEGIVILELLHRVVVCMFETIWLKGGENGRIGGATPGKSIMKLRVVRCESVLPVFALDGTGEMASNGRVIVRPGTDMGLGVSFLRAAVKNFVLAVFIPTSFAFFYFPNNRTGYDMICHTIVVEEPIRLHRVIPEWVDEL